MALIKRINFKDFVLNLLNENDTYDYIEYVTDYLYKIYYNKLDYDYAYEYFLKNDVEINVGACTSIRKGNWFARNFDWIYSEDAEFIVKTERKHDKYATIGVASLTNLSNTFVQSKQKSSLYKILPFTLLDGINEYGLCISTNVVPLDFEPTDKTLPDGEKKFEICNLMLPRFCLDRFKTATECVTYLKNHVSLYPSKKLSEVYHYEQHWLIADKNNTYLLEIIDSQIIATEISEHPFITNFYIHGVQFNDDGSVYTPATQDEEHNASITNLITQNGCGLERYNLVNERINDIQTLEDMRGLLIDLFYTNAYSHDHNWCTEFVGLDGLTVSSNDSDFYDIIDSSIEYLQNRSRDPEDDYYGTWHTGHSSIYDIENKTLNLVVQQNTLNEINEEILYPIDKELYNYIEELKNNE